MRTLTLPNGEQFVVRPIEPSDKDRLTASLGRMSAQTIQRRFLASKQRFSKRELAYLTEVDGDNHVALVVLDRDWIVAVARFVRFADEPDTAEMAIVVGDPYQRRGLGRALARLLADVALDHGIEHFAGTMAGENRAARAIVRTISDHMECERISMGVREVRFGLTPHTPPHAQAA